MADIQVLFACLQSWKAVSNCELSKIDKNETVKDNLFGNCLAVSARINL